MLYLSAAMLLVAVLIPVASGQMAICQEYNLFSLRWLLGYLFLIHDGIPQEE